MDDWRKKLKELLMSFDYPVEIADIRRILGVFDDEIPQIFEEIVRITKSLTGTPYALVVEEGKCSSCTRSVSFTGKLVFECPHCKQGVVSLPKVCINPR